MTLKAFLERVVWPGVQTSLVGGEGEAPDALDLDVEANEADAGVADAKINANYVADVTSTQGAWAPWLTHDWVAGSGLYLFSSHCRHFIFIIGLQFIYDSTFSSFGNSDS